MGIWCLFVPRLLELTLKFFRVRDVFAENGIDAGATSSMSMSFTGVLLPEAVEGLAFEVDLGISFSTAAPGDRPPDGDESGVE
jgi:hypothetical protein